MDEANKQNFLAYQDQNLSIRPKLFCDAKTLQMEPSPKYPESGERALAIRIYAGFPGHGGQKKFANHLGVSNALWGAIERGEAAFSYGTFLKLKKLYAVDHEWLREGYEGKMPPSLMNPLRQILDKIRNGTTVAS